MPVLSPHRSSSSGLSGAYRSTYSSALDRPYYSTSSYSPRIYSERFTSRSYTDLDGRRVFTRSGSITEDGVTTRFREETREGSAVRDVTRDSIRENSVLDYPRRDSSLTREGRLSTANVFDSVAELRNKYSPANYVPACRRNVDNISRSKSNNDIGLPPIETKAIKKKVNESLNFNGVSNANNTNDNEDDNGNRASVADLRKRFDERTTRSSKSPPLQIDGIKISENRFKKLDTAKRPLTCKKPVKNGIDSTAISEPKEADGEEAISREKGRINNFASYIPSKDFERGDEVEINGGNKVDGSEQIESNGINDLNSKVGRSTVSPGGSSGLATQNRRSSERHRFSGDEEVCVEKASAGANATTRPTKTLGLNGLKNIGNTCFMNSVIQCLSNTKPLLEFVRKEGYVKEINTSTSSMKGALMKAFAEVITELWSEDSSDRVVNTVSLKSQIQRFAPRFMGYAQQDAQEFLRYLLEGLHEDVNRVTEKPKPILTEIDEKLSDNEKAAESWQRYLRMDNSRIVDYFVGQLKSTLKCTHCGHCSVTFDPFWDLSLPIPQRTGQLRLSQCLDSFTREETLDGDEKPTCSKCKERRRCTKSFTIQKFPKILVIHLKRFSPTERFRGKLSVTVDFPLEGLDMSNYAADSVSPCRYNLYAISNHSGTTYSGHYTAYCRHPYNLSWHEYNDSRVSSISPKSIISGEAYVLFYEQDGQRSHL